MTLPGELGSRDDRPARRSAARRGPAPGEPADADLMRRVAEGDGAALELLWDRYARPCAALARRLLIDEGLAQDVVQEVFLTLWRQPARYDSERGGFASWLLAMTHHKAVDVVRREEHRRSRRVSDEVLDGQEDMSTRVDEAVWTAVRRERVRHALAGLPPVQKEALGLAYYGGYTQREIAEMTGTPLGTVKTRMLAGMRRLRDVLDGYDAEGGLAAP
ncbi:MAG TPA: sigma-70 family RNA polymerase sigma factor [Mycobacteriales bacterium]|nr:sigma-70 family RNA polymerase sigma factor [Mycobacteriales bacterium]